MIFYYFPGEFGLVSYGTTIKIKPTTKALYC